MDQDKRERVQKLSLAERYGAFSIGQSNVTALKHYIRSQKEHHQRVTFQDEYRKFLKAYGIDYDEKYVWD